MNRLYILLTIALLLGSLSNVSAQQSKFCKEINQKLEHYNDIFPEDRVYLHLDKPMYKPGETVWFTAYVRNASDLKASDQSDIVHVDLIDPSGNTINGNKIICKDGIGIGDFDLDQTLNGGIYKLKAWTNWQKNDTNTLVFEKEIQVIKPVLPRLLMKLEFKEKGFGPGDIATASFEIKDLSNKAISNHSFKYIASLKGETYQEKEASTDENGKAEIEIPLPEELNTNDGLLNVIIQYKGETESISRSIPIQLNNIQFELYPESGDLVDGFPTRIGFQALNEYGKPTDIEGLVVDNNGTTISEFKSYHHGMGAFDFTPYRDKDYIVKITKPLGIKQEFEIPRILKNGLVLNSKINSNNELVATIQSGFEEEITLIAQIRGEIYYSASHNLKTGVNSIHIPLQEFPAGVCQLTLFDKKEIPRAERLVFVNKNKQLNIEITTDKEIYEPREKVEMQINLTDERGMPMPGNISLAVVDDKLLTHADDKSGNILSKLLLEADITGDVEEPYFYFDPKEPKADLALDYLLMTRGWRRFEWREVQNSTIPEIVHVNEQARIAGIVYSGTPDQPIENVRVQIKGDSIYYLTDKKGNFSIPVDEIIKPLWVKFYYKPWKNKDKQENYFRVTGFENDLKIDISIYSYKSCEPINLPFEKNYFENVCNDSLGILSGIIVDFYTKDVIPNVAIKLVKDDTIVQQTVTSSKGKFKFKKLPQGPFALLASSMGYENILSDKINIYGHKNTIYNLALERCIKQLEPLELIDYEVPLISRDQTSSGGTVTTSGLFGKTKKNKYINWLQKNKRARNSELDNLSNDIAPDIELDLSINNDDAEVQNMDASGVNIDNYDYRNGLVRISVNESDLNMHREYYIARTFPKVAYKSKKVSQNRKNDFRTTIHWEGNLKIDSTGSTNIEFYNSDANSSFTTTAECISPNGLIGRKLINHTSQAPFYLHGKVPEIICKGDLLDIPIILHNNTTHLVEGKLEILLPEGFHIEKNFNNSVIIKSQNRKILNLHIETKGFIKGDSLLVRFTDSIQKIDEFICYPIQTKPVGYPTYYQAASESNHSVYMLNLNDAIPGSIKSSINIFPNSTTELLHSIKSIFKEPHGCFEQLSSATLPNILAVEMLQEYGMTGSDAYLQAMDYIRTGYKKLSAYECKTGGFEWYGRSPGNLPLTAYGLLEFHLMKNIYSEVDTSLIARTKAWLLSKRDGNGSFTSESFPYYYYGPNPEVINAYICWALTETGVKGLGPEILQTYKTALKTKDPYIISLAALSCYNTRQYSLYEKLIKKLLRLQKKDFSWKGLTCSITRSGIQSFTIETTALATLALQKGSLEQDRITGAIQYLLSKKQGYGSYGSSQGTALTLMAIIEHFDRIPKGKSNGKIYLKVDGETIQKQKYNSSMTVPIKFNKANEYISENTKTIEIISKQKSHPIPHTVLIEYTTKTPDNSPKTRIDITTQLTSDNIIVGETTRLQIQLKNLTKDILSSPIAIIGIPAGLSLQPWQLKELNEMGEAFDYFEIIDNNIVLYYRNMAPNEVREINLDLKADIAGEYTSEASVAYEYYHNEHKNWTKGTHVVIKKQ